MLNKLKRMIGRKKNQRYSLLICHCGQPITRGNERFRSGVPEHQGWSTPYCSNLGCPLGESIFDNLRQAQKEGFDISFQR